MLCSWARHFTLTMPLSTQVYKWVPANLMLEVTLRQTTIPSRGGVEILLVASCYWNRDKLRPDGPLGSYADFTVLKRLWSFSSCFYLIFSPFLRSFCERIIWSCAPRFLITEQESSLWPSPLPTLYRGSTQAGEGDHLGPEPPELYRAWKGVFKDWTTGSDALKDCSG